MEKVVILGSGIAGWTAAIYSARANLSPLVIAGKESGGQLTLTTSIENFPGFPDGVKGPELVERAKRQAEKFGARLRDKIAAKILKKDGYYEIDCGDEKIETKAVIIATGASARMLGLESDKKYLGKGVSTCAICDAYFFKGNEVIVVGGGDGACEESLFLSKFADKITIIHRRDKLRASKIMQERVFRNEKIDFMWDSEVVEVIGDGKKVTGVKIRNVKDNSVTEKKIGGVFLAIGHIPNTKFLEGVVELDKKGYLKADKRMRTNLPGVFAAGDVHDTVYKQAITASAMGCQAAIEAEKYLEES